MGLFFSSLNQTASWSAFKALRPAENLSLIDAQRLVNAIRGLRLPVPSLWLGTETSPMEFSPQEFAQNAGPIGDPLNWKLSWQVRPEAPSSERDTSKEEYSAADFARWLQGCAAGGTESLGSFAARVMNAAADNQTTITAAEGFLSLLQRHPEAQNAAIQMILRAAAQ